jgi:hypothetical protein
VRRKIHHCHRQTPNPPSPSPYSRFSPPPASPVSTAGRAVFQCRPRRVLLPRPPRPALLKAWPPPVLRRPGPPSKVGRHPDGLLAGTPTPTISSIARRCSLHPRRCHLHRGSLAVAAALPMPFRLVAMVAEDREKESAMGVDWNCEGRRGSRRREEKR